MASLATWLEAHRDTLVSASLQELTSREVLRKEAESPVRWFFDNLIKAIAQQEHDRLEMLLRNWVTMSSIPINGHVVGLIPVLGVFKRVIWREYQSDPPTEHVLDWAIELDGIVMNAAEFLSKIEAAALLDAASHKLTTHVEQSLEHVDRMKSGFVSVAAHELKTPITVIEGYASMLKAQLAVEAGSREAAMFQGIQNGILRLRQIVEDMVDVSLLESNLLTLDFQPAWLQRIVNTAVAETASAIKTRAITLNFKKDTLPDVATIGDPEQLLKAFQKVLLNAVKYTPDGGTITIFGANRKGYHEIVIADTGIGIAAENLDLIFQKFVTVGDPARHSSGRIKFKGGGPGLGLVIARGIVEAHNGSIWAESPGHDEKTCPGTHFHIMLPTREVALSMGMLPFGMTELPAGNSVSKDVSALIATLDGAKTILPMQKTRDESGGEAQSPATTETASNPTAARAQVAEADEDGGD